MVASHPIHYFSVFDSANMTSLIDLNGDTSPWTLPFLSSAGPITVNQAATAGGSENGDDRVDLAVTLPQDTAWIRVEWKSTADAANRWQITDLRLEDDTSHRFWQLPFQKSYARDTTQQGVYQPRVARTLSGEPIYGLASKLVLRIRFESEQLSTTASGGDTFALDEVAVRAGVTPTRSPVIYTSGPEAWPVIEMDPYSATGEPLSAHISWTYPDPNKPTATITLAEGQVKPDRFGRLKWTADRMLPPGITDATLDVTTFFGMFGMDPITHVQSYTAMSAGSVAPVTSDDMAATVVGSTVSIDSPAAVSAVSWQIERSPDGGTTWDPVYINQATDWDDTTGAQVSLRTSRVEGVIDYPPLNTPVIYRAFYLDEQGDGGPVATLPPTALEGVGGFGEAYPTQQEDEF